MDQRYLDFCELSNELTEENVTMLKIHMKVPTGICDNDCDGLTFLTAIVSWEGFNPYSFYLALTSLNRPHIVTIAMKLPMLCVSEPIQQAGSFAEPLSMRSFLELLRTKISQKEWQVVAINIRDSLQGGNDFESIIKECLESNLISKDLKNFIRLLMAIKLFDITVKIREYQSLFGQMSEEEFLARMKKELNLQSAEIRQWQHKLKQFINIQNTMVKQLLGDEDTVSLSSVYVDLTIVKGKPRPVRLEDETTFNEIAYLRKIASKEIEVTPIDIAEELRSYKTEKPEIWCIIGNPGCGKTFLSKRIALRFSHHELTHISYSIAISCRNTEWYSMESNRLEEDKEVTSEFVQGWLCLGLPVASDWAKDLAKHLSKSDGEGLLLIIDGLDEFTKKIPFDKSLLYLLLTRQTLHKSTIIITTRPGAWTDVSLEVDRFYQVLGFSPENRDIYFEKQIIILEKLASCKNLLSRYDEINQLSLIPVNASLFAALMNDESVIINALTQLYRELICYLIRRQLSRMALKELSKVKKIELFDVCVLDCLYAIGRIALMGVASRELTFTDKVTMTLNCVEIDCHSLGLAHEFYTSDSVGIVKKVWAFAHLTMQEFISAIFLKSTSWTSQCMSVRYIANSIEDFSVYKMVVRFLCGLLCEKSAVLLTILFRKLLPETIYNLPMYHQLGFGISRLQPYAGWYGFTQMYFQLISILFETDSLYILCALKRLIPVSISLYLDREQTSVSPNESICFIQSLPLSHHINLIYINTSHVSIEYFVSLMKESGSFSLDQLAVKFDQFLQKKEPMSLKILAYTNEINQSGLNDRTRISIEISWCDIEDLTGIDLFSINSLKLYKSKCSTELLHQLTNSVVSTHYFQYLYIDSSEHANIIIPALSQATQLKGLYINQSLSTDTKQLIEELMPKLTQLREIVYPDYSLLPHMAHLTALSSLEIVYGSEKSLSANLLQVLNTNNNTLKVVTLLDLHSIGLERWTEMLAALQCCVNLVNLELGSFLVSLDGISQWTPTLRCLESLLYLYLYKVSLYDVGLLAVCQGFAKHQSITEIYIYDCGLSSMSCEPLTNLIPTTRQLEILRVTDLSKPDPGPIETLKLTAENYSINFSYR